MRRVRLIIIACLFFGGCVSTHTIDVKTGMFGNDLRKLVEVYRAVDTVGNGKIDSRTMEQMGFNFSAQNVERLSGAAVFRKIFGDTVFQHAVSNPQEAAALLTEMNRYYAFSIPFRGIVTKDDRFYFSRRNIVSRGDDMLILFIFHREEGDKNVLVFHDFTYTHIDSHESYFAFAEGILEVFQKYGTAAAGVNDVLQKIHDLLKKN